LRPPFSLRSKIILLVSGTAFLGSVLIGGLNFYHTRQVATEHAVEDLAEQTRLAALNVQAVYASAKDDAMVVLSTPPIQGFIRSLENGGTDPSKEASRTQWRGFRKNLTRRSSKCSTH